MPNILPPTPIGSPPGSSYWNDWYEKLRNFINSGSVAVLWPNINFAGSNLSDLANRAHSSLQSIQGGTPGEYNHLTNAELASLGTFIDNVTKTKAGLPTTSDIAAGTWAIYKDTSGGTVRVWANDGGVMKSVTLT
jgi:hypothetical protein